MFLLSKCQHIVLFFRQSRMGLTVHLKANHSFWEILLRDVNSSSSSYMTFPSNTDPTVVSMASVASLEVS